MRRASRLLLVVALLGACRSWSRRVEVSPDVRAPSSSSGEPTQSGSRGGVRNGVYSDPIHGFSIPVPVGWQWLEGPEDGALRLRTTDVATGTTVEVWFFPGGDPRPRPRDDCAWLFDDHGPYGGPGGEMHRTVATCVPYAADAPRIFAWMVPGVDSGVWQVEGGVPPEHLIRGDALVRAIVEQFELSDAP